MHCNSRLGFVGEKERRVWKKLNSRRVHCIKVGPYSLYVTVGVFTHWQQLKIMFQSVFEEVKSCIVNIESIYSRTVCNFISCPKIFLINTLHMYNVNTQMHTPNNDLSLLDASHRGKELAKGFLALTLFTQTSCEHCRTTKNEKIQTNI